MVDQLLPFVKCNPSMPQEHRFCVRSGGFSRVLGDQGAPEHSLRTLALIPARLSSRNQCSCVYGPPDRDQVVDHRAELHRRYIRHPLSGAGAQAGVLLEGFGHTLYRVVLAHGHAVQRVCLDPFAPPRAGEPRDTQRRIVAARRLGPASQGDVDGVWDLGRQLVRGEEGS
jgi:hypothetical protein